MEKKLISFCIPCYNESGNIELMYNKLKSKLEELREKYEFEVIFEDNKSTDDTVDLLRELAEKDKEVKVILNARNFGAMKNSGYIMFQAKGDAVIGLPCDLQVPLELIKDYLSAWEEGYDVVLGQIESSEESTLMYSVRSLYYKIMDEFSEIPQLYHVTGAGLFDKKALELIESLAEPEPNFRYLVTELGLKYKLIPYVQPQRQHGKSSYNVYRYYNQAVDTFTEVSKKPLRYITNIGVMFIIVSALCIVVTLGYKALYWNAVKIAQILIIEILFLFGAIQIFCIGMLGEYIHIILKRLVYRPMVVEEERINFDENREKVFRKS